MRTFIYVIAVHFPEIIDKIIDGLRSIGDKSDVMDIKNWTEKRSPEAAEALIIRRCAHDEDVIQIIEERIVIELELKGSST